MKRWLKIAGITFGVTIWTLGAAAVGAHDGMERGMKIGVTQGSFDTLMYVLNICSQGGVVIQDPNGDKYRCRREIAL